MASPSVKKLTQEIHDEFLVCKICLEPYKNPKCLSCLHTFCEECIESHIMSEVTYKKYIDYRDFTCPLCRKRTQLPIGGVRKLADNFLVSGLSELVRRQRPSKFPSCDICRSLNGKSREAISKCLDCAKILCAPCVRLHRQTKVTAGHSLFDLEIEKDVECKEHKDEAIRFYCEPCDACVCILCTFHDHRDHDILQFGEAATRHRTGIVQMVESCQETVDKFDSQIDAMARCEDTIHIAEQQIHDAAIEFIQQVRNQEKQLIEGVHSIYGAECMELLETRKTFSSQMENLRSTCSLTEVILSGKDIELLLLKKNVEEKLEAMNQVEVKNLPETINKVVQYVKGSINLGYVDDHGVVKSLEILAKLKEDNTQKLLKNGSDVGDAGGSLDDTSEDQHSSGKYADVGTQTDDVMAVTSSDGKPIKKKEFSQVSKPAKHFRT